VTSSSGNESHRVIFILDPLLQHLPFENLPLFRERSTSRLPSVSFLPQLLPKRPCDQLGTGFYVLNPSGDLAGTQERLQESFEQRGWSGIVGRPPSEEEMLSGLGNNDLLVYVFCLLDGFSFSNDSVLRSWLYLF